MSGPQPVTSSSDQILIKLGEMGIQLAHIEEQLKPIADHEARIRSLEKWKYGLPITGLAAIASAAIAVYSLVRG